MSLASLVKELRDRTGAGMMDCKKALEACDQDIEKAIDWLRENGIAKAAKKGDRVAAEGLTRILVDGNKAILFELNSETDFVARNEQFLALMDEVANTLMSNEFTSVEDALQIDVNGETLATLVDRGTATIGEKLNLRRAQAIMKTDSQLFGTYSHGGRISCVVVLENGSEETAKQVCMHVASEKPQFLNESEIAEDVVVKEREMLLIEAVREQIFKAILKEESIKPINLTPEREAQVNATVDERFAAKFEAEKDSQMIQNIVNGKLKKFFKDICLNEQMSIFDNKVAIKNYVAEQGGTIVSFARYEVGEGIEKVEVDFAAEVAAQTNL